VRAQAKLGNLEGAVESFSKSLSNARTKQTLELLRKAEADLTEKKKRDYIDPVGVPPVCSVPSQIHLFHPKSMLLSSKPVRVEYIAL
jgi:hypothetical protein